MSVFRFCLVTFCVLASILVNAGTSSFCVFAQENSAKFGDAAPSDASSDKSGSENGDSKDATASAAQTGSGDASKTDDKSAGKDVAKEVGADELINDSVPQTAPKPKTMPLNSTSLKALSKTLPKPLSKSESAANEKTSGETPSGEKTADEKSSNETFSLVSGRQKGTLDKIEVSLEAVGDVNQFLEDQESKSNKMEVLAGFRYEERTELFSSKPGSHLMSVRNYDAARAKILVGDQFNLPELDPDRRLIICDVNKSVTTLYSPTGALKDDQLLLIEDLPANTLLLDHLLPAQENVKIGDKWDVPEKALTSLLGLDVIEKHDIQASLTSVTDGVALVELNGNAEGAFLGSASTMEVRAKYQFDLKLRRITWLGLVIQEDRSIGNVGPAVTIVAKLMIKIHPEQQSTILTDEAVEALDKTLTDEQLKVRYDSTEKGGWRFLHGRNWYVIFDTKGSTKLRLLQNGELVSQCDIAQMGKVVSSSALSTLESFQEDLKKGLGESFGKVLSSEKGKTKKGNRELKVVVEGSSGNLSLVWTYYLLTKSDGSQVIIAFVVQKDRLEVFDDLNREIVDSFEIYTQK